MPCGQHIYSSVTSLPSSLALCREHVPCSARGGGCTLSMRAACVLRHGCLLSGLARGIVTTSVRLDVVHGPFLGEGQPAKSRWANGALLSCTVGCGGRSTLHCSSSESPVHDGDTWGCASVRGRRGSCLPPSAVRAAADTALRARVPTRGTLLFGAYPDGRWQHAHLTCLSGPNWCAVSVVHESSHGKRECVRWGG